MIALVLRLLIAHVVTDFLLQPGRWVQDKQSNKIRSPYLYLHVLLTGIIAWGAVGFDVSYWWIILSIVISHYLIDLVKVYFFAQNIYTYVIDQLAHALVILLCAGLYFGNEVSLTEVLHPYMTNKYLAYFLGYLVVMRPVGIAVGFATRRWREDIAADGGDRDSLAKAGNWIGVLERILVLTFVLLGRYEAIGFLIAAKSILRFSDKGLHNPRKQTEYVLIGTLLSFTLALTVGLVVKLGSKVVF